MGVHTWVTGQFVVVVISSNWSGALFLVEISRKARKLNDDLEIYWWDVCNIGYVLVCQTRQKYPGAYFIIWG